MRMNRNRRAENKGRVIKFAGNRICMLTIKLYLHILNVSYRTNLWAEGYFRI